MDGYARLPASWAHAMPDDMVKDTGGTCRMCPKNPSCTGLEACDAGFGLVWVPDHIKVIWLLHASDDEKSSLHYRLQKLEDGHAKTS